MAKSKQSKRRPVAVRVSERAHKLARLIEPSRDLGANVEFALEFLLAARLWEIDRRSGDKLSVEGEIVGDGPMSSDARARLHGHQAHIVDRIIERAVRQGIESYRAEKHFEAKAAESSKGD